MPLTDNLVDYWEFEEASGNRTGSHAGIVLADNNTVGSGTGKIGNAIVIVPANDEFLSKTDDATIGLSTDTAFTWALWVNLTNNPGTGVRFLVTKIQASGNFPTEYSFRYDFDNVRFRLTVEIDNVPTGTTLNYDQALSTGTWYFLVFWHDPVADTINIQFNNGTPTSTAHAIGTGDLTGPLNIGAEVAGNAGWDGLIDQVGFWKRVLTAGERTTLYNSGNGLSYAALAGTGGSPVVTPNPNELQRSFNMARGRR